MYSLSDTSASKLLREERTDAEKQLGQATCIRLPHVPV
jgi:hypothetical protein